MTFLNEQVEIEDIPQVQNLEYKGLHRNYLTVELLGISILWIVIGLAILMNIIFNSEIRGTIFPPLLFGFWILLVATTSFVVVKGFKRKKYALRERDIVYQQGLIWRKFVVLPFNRVQHAEVHQGPIERIFDLGKLKVYTAGGSSSDLTISGLEVKKAQSLKHFILQKTVMDEEE